MAQQMHHHKKRILIVEDEHAIRDMVRMALNRANFLSDEAETVKDAQHKISNQRPNLIILDWMLPTMSGFQFTQQLKRNPLTRDIPVIMLTAKAEEDSKVRALEAGADDYITKPFSPRELIARIQAILRRGLLIQSEGILTIEALVINTATRQVAITDQLIPLSPMEYRLLHFFVTHPERIYSRDELLTHVWPPDAIADERTVDALIKRLRKQLKPYHYDQYIRTAHGTGYYFIYEYRTR